MPFVIDASIAISWALEDEASATSRAAWARLTNEYEEVHAPALWWMEVRNALIVNERRKRITFEKTTIFLSALSRLHVALDSATEESALLSLARQQGLTVYDAAYLELAQRQGVALATLDADLAKAARKVGVPLLG